MNTNLIQLIQQREEIASQMMELSKERKRLNEEPCIFLTDFENETKI